MSADLADLAAWVLAAIDAVEELAEEAASDGIDTWKPEDPSYWWNDEHPMSMSEKRHIALHDPKAVLRRCSADRRVLARHSPMPGTFPELPPVCTYCEENDSHGARVLWPCADFVDLADAHGITVKEATS